MDRVVEQAVEQFQRDRPDVKGFIDFDLLSEEVARRFSAFEYVGKDHIMGIRMLGSKGRPNIMYGLQRGRPEVLDIVRPGKAFGYVPAGVPHHLTQDYGWWHVNDTEELYLPIPTQANQIAFVILESVYPDRHDRFQWYCLNCYRFLHERRVNTGRVGIEGYWEAEAAAVKEFNEDVRLRTCKGCGAVHPLAYSFWDPSKEDLW
jgi:hypothetical protein